VSADAELIAGRYRLQIEVGSGGMGVVWRARDEVLGRTVAIKALAIRFAAGGSAGDEGARRAMREARIAARLQHPNVIGVYDVVEHDRRPFLVMEFLESRSLSELLADGAALPPREVARIGAQVAAGLAAAHGAGIVHRDVKPGNVLLSESGAVKLTDFGISRAVGDTTVTASGIVLGTLTYIAPEVGQGRSADARSDVYSLGATLYAAVEGRPPFETGESAIALLYQIVHEDFPPPRLAGPLAPVLLWMLDKDPDRRPTMPQVQRALETIEASLAEPEAGAEEPEDAADVIAMPATAVLADPSEPEPEATLAAAPASTPASASASDGGAPAALAPTKPARVRPARLAGFLGRFRPGESPRSLIAGLVVVALVVAGAVALALRGGNGAADVAGLNPSASRSGTAAHSPTATPSATSAHASATPSATGSATASSSATTSQSVASQLTSTIIDYYKLMPGNLDAGWTWMTADYQTNHARGRSGYASFWSQFKSVAVSGVTATPPNTVVATITYYSKNGSVTQERTRFGMVFQDGRWKIASSSVV
jgi:hypothetical protein